MLAAQSCQHAQEVVLCIAQSWANHSFVEINVVAPQYYLCICSEELLFAGTVAGLS